MTGTLQLEPVIQLNAWRRHRLAIGVTFVLAGPALGFGIEAGAIYNETYLHPQPLQIAAGLDVPVVEGPAHPTMTVEPSTAPRVRLVEASVRAVTHESTRLAVPVVTMRAPAATSPVVSSRPSSKGAPDPVTKETPTSTAATPSAVSTSASPSAGPTSVVMTGSPTTPGLP